MLTDSFDPDKMPIILYSIRVCLFGFALGVFCMVLRFLTENAYMAKHLLDFSVKVTLS